jgi:hypothetical protein
MNWSLIFKLSLFGLAMALATVYVIPSDIEPFFWIAVFIICAYIIARSMSSKYFVHGLFLGIFNSVWIIAAHVFLFNTYIANHPKEAELMGKMPLPDSPKLMMLCVGLLIGIASGIVIGILSVIASKIVKKPTT